MHVSAKHLERLVRWDELRGWWPMDQHPPVLRLDHAEDDDWQATVDFDHVTLALPLPPRWQRSAPEPDYPPVRVKAEPSKPWPVLPDTPERRRRRDYPVLQCLRETFLASAPLCRLPPMHPVIVAQREVMDLTAAQIRFFDDLPELRKHLDRAVLQLVIESLGMKGVLL